MAAGIHRLKYDKHKDKKYELSHRFLFYKSMKSSREEFVDLHLC